MQDWPGLIENESTNMLQFLQSSFREIRKELVAYARLHYGESVIVDHLQKIVFRDGDCPRNIL